MTDFINAQIRVITYGFWNKEINQLKNKRGIGDHLKVGTIESDDRRNINEGRSKFSLKLDKPPLGGGIYRKVATL